MAEYLAIKNWDKRQPGRRGKSDWIKDYTNKDSHDKYEKLSFYQRYVLDALRRLRGLKGENTPHDPMYIARSLHAARTDRPHIQHAVSTLLAHGFLILTNQQHDFVDKDIEIDKEREEELKPPARKAPAKRPEKVQAISPETSSVQAVMYLPLNSGDEFGISAEDFGLWKKLYPGVDVMQELRAMVGWCHANPTRRKTKTGVKAFINRWLAKAQNDPKAAQNFRSGNGQARRVSKADDRERRIIEDAYEFAGIEPTRSVDRKGENTLALPGNGQAGIRGLARNPELVPTERDSVVARLPDAQSAKAGG